MLSTLGLKQTYWVLSTNLSESRLLCSWIPSIFRSVLLNITRRFFFGRQWCAIWNQRLLSQQNEFSINSTRYYSLFYRRAETRRLKPFPFDSISTNLLQFIVLSKQTNNALVSCYLNPDLAIYKNTTFILF